VARGWTVLAVGTIAHQQYIGDRFVKKRSSAKTNKRELKWEGRDDPHFQDIKRKEMKKKKSGLVRT
jgi:hypothetical protein